VTFLFGCAVSELPGGVFPNRRHLLGSRTFSFTEYNAAVSSIELVSRSLDSKTRQFGPFLVGSIISALRESTHSASFEFPEFLELAASAGVAECGIWCLLNTLRSKNSSAHRFSRQSESSFDLSRDPAPWNARQHRFPQKAGEIAADTPAFCSREFPPRPGGIAIQYPQ
jgi:hypothetical protein